MATEQQAIMAYRRMHEMAQEKREISKAQKEEKAIVDEYLAKYPEGFVVTLTDARDKHHTYAVKHTEKTRVSLIKDVLANKIGCAVNELTPSVIAEAVRDGVIALSDVRAFEDVNTHTAIQKTKIRKQGKKDQAQ